jgi:uncharacterized protein (DUF4213/DUF364 family)
MMNLLEDLLASISVDAPLRSVLVGAHWSVVCSRFCGLASTIIGDKPHGHERVRQVGRLHEKSAKALAEFAFSDNLLEASIGVAALNSLIDVDDRLAVELNAMDVLLERGRAQRVALVGHFPFIPQLRQVAAQLWVMEQQPVEGEYPAEAAVDLIPQADLVALTGSALINHTLDRLLALCRPGAQVVVLGPSAPLSPVLFEHGASLISGAKVIDEQAVLRTVGQGAILPQVEGIQLLTIAKGHPSLGGNG